MHHWKKKTLQHPPVASEAFTCCLASGKSYIHPPVAYSNLQHQPDIHITSILILFLPASRTEHPSMPSSTATVPKPTKGTGTHFSITCNACGVQGEYSLAAMNSHSLWCAAARKKAEANTKKAAAAAHRKPHRGFCLFLFLMRVFFSTRVLYNWTDRVSLYSCSN